VDLPEPDGTAAGQRRDRRTDRAARHRQQRWGYQRIQGELLKPGHRVSASTILRVVKALKIPPAIRQAVLEAARRRERAAEMRRAVLHTDLGQPDGVNVAEELARDRASEC
jgi:hypothetical protein